jgi:uncharacterized Zn finger protein
MNVFSFVRKKMSTNVDEEILCLSCGSDEFKILRTIPSQILLKCLKCGNSHILEIVNVDGNPVLILWETLENTDKMRAKLS